MSLNMKSALAGGLGLIMLAACGGSEDTGEIAAPPVPPTPAAPEAVTEEVSAPEAPEAPAPVETEAAETEEHDHEAHDHGEHEHGEDAHEEHDHGEHEHHDHAGGEAHVHGLAEMAITREGSRLTVTFESPTANFGFSEAASDLPEGNTVGEDTFAVIGGECLNEMTNVSAVSDGQHGSVSIEKRYSCSNIDGVSAVRVTAFEAYSGFETVDAVYLTDADQVAAELTADSPELAIN